MNRPFRQLMLLALLPAIALLLPTACDQNDNPVHILTPADVAGTWWNSSDGSEPLPIVFPGSEDIAYIKVGQALVLNDDGTGCAATFFFNGNDEEAVYAYGGKDVAPLTFSIARDGEISLIFDDDTPYADIFKSLQVRYTGGQIVCQNGDETKPFRLDSSKSPYIAYWLAPKFTDCGFADIADVFDELKADEAVVFLLRHGERGEDYSPAGLLTENGKLQAQLVGRKIRNGEQAFYAHSDYDRTKQSCENVAKGRGDAFIHEEWDILNGEYFMNDADMLKESGNYNWQAVSQWAYEGLYEDIGFYNLDQRSEEWLNCLREKLPTMKRINVLVSHDYTVLALTIYLSQRQIDLHYWINCKWIHYLAGIAIIIDTEGKMRFRTVCGLDTGYQIK